MCVIIEGFGGDTEEAKGGDKQKALKQKVLFGRCSQKDCAIVEGFADRSESKSKQTSLQKFIKNLQPISVGV